VITAIDLDVVRIRHGIRPRDDRGEGQKHAAIRTVPRAVRR
jgi:hypothetical protein